MLPPSLEAMVIVSPFLCEGLRTLDQSEPLLSVFLSSRSRCNLVLGLPLFKDTAADSLTSNTWPAAPPVRVDGTHLTLVFS